MNWFSKASELHVKLATLLSRLDGMGTGLKDLATDLKDTSQRVARLEGMMLNSTNPEILRQIAEINNRLSSLEFRLSQMAPQNFVQNAPIQIEKKSVG